MAMAATNQVPGPLVAASEEDMEISSNIGDFGREDEIDIDVDIVIDPGQDDDEDFMLDDAQPENGHRAEYRDDIMLDEDRDGDGDVEIEDGLMQDQASLPDEHLTDVSEPAHGGDEAKSDIQDQEAVEPRNEADDDLIDYEDDYLEAPQTTVQSVQPEARNIPEQTAELALPNNVQIDQQAEERFGESAQNANQYPKDQADEFEDSTRAEAPVLESTQNACSLGLTSREQHVSDETTAVITDVHDHGDEHRRDEASEQETALHDQVEFQEPQNISAHNEDASALSQLPFDGPVEETDETYYQAFAHPVIVIYVGSEISLFPPTEDSNSETFFLQDVSLVHHSIRDLLLACREVLGDTIRDEDELELDVAELGLCISEDSSHATTTSFAQILDVYVQLYHLDGVENPAPLYMTLTTRTRFSSRLQALLGAAADCQGMSQLTFLEVSADEAVHEDSPSDTHGTVAEQQEEILYDQEQSEHESQTEKIDEIHFRVAEDNLDDGATKDLNVGVRIDETHDADPEGTQSVLERTEDSYDQGIDEQSGFDTSERPADEEASAADSEHETTNSALRNEPRSPKSVNREASLYKAAAPQKTEQRAPAVESQQLETVKQTPKQQQKPQARIPPVTTKDEDEIGYSSDEDEENSKNEKTPVSSTIEGDNSPTDAEFEAGPALTSVAGMTQHRPDPGFQDSEETTRQETAIQTTAENVQEPPTESEHCQNVLDEPDVKTDGEYVEFDFAEHGKGPDEQFTVYDAQNHNNFPKDDTEPYEANSAHNNAELGGDAADVYEEAHDYDEVGWEDGDEDNPVEQHTAVDEAVGADESSYAEFQTAWENLPATEETGSGEIETEALESHVSGSQTLQVNKTVAKPEDDDDLIDYDDDEDLPSTTAAHADSRAEPTTLEPSSSVKRGWEEVSHQGDDVSDEQDPKRVKSD